VPDAISKSYRADANVKAEAEAADIKIPIDPEVGGVVPLLPLKFNPVPSEFLELDKVKYVEGELSAKLDLIIILPEYPVKSTGTLLESLY
jgi:hypothetical protein